MICIKCDNEVFADKPNAIIEQEFRGQRLQVKVTASACTQCGWQTLALGQTDELRRLTADAYREKHGLLKSAEIVSRRTRLGMSQREFAAFLRVGEASVKRWETWQVQDASSDELIRVKSDFLAQLQQHALLVVQQTLFAGHFSATVRVKSSSSKEFSPAQFLTERQGFKKEFSLLDCQQFTPGGYLGRKCFAEDSNTEYDTNPDFAAAA
jgi:putative zinc finger/helix-turn-helix YgiT family protein